MKKFLSVVLSITMTVSSILMPNIILAEDNEIDNQNEVAEKIIDVQEDDYFDDAIVDDVVEDNDVENTEDQNEEEIIVVEDDVIQVDETIDDLVDPLKSEDDNLMTASQDDDFNVILTSDYSKFFEALSKGRGIEISIEQNNEQVFSDWIYEGSDLEDENNWWAGYILEKDSDTGTYSDVIIPADCIFSMNIPSGKATFCFYYEGTKYESTIDNFVGCKTFSLDELKIEQNSNCDLIISCSDTCSNTDECINFLRNLAKETSVYKKTSCGEIYLNGKQLYNESWIWNNEYKEHEDYKYRFEDNKVIIPKETLLENNIPSGKIEIRLESYGYTKLETEIDINACKTENVSFTTSIDNDGNLYIRSNNTDWLQALARYRIYDQAKEYQNESEICLIDSIGSWHRFYNQAYKDNIDTEYFYDEFSYRYVDNGNDKYIIIPIEEIYYHDIPDGTVIERIMFRAYGYTEYDSTLANTITLKGCKSYPQSLNVYENDFGDIVIECSNLDYLDKLVSNQDNISYKYRNEISILDDYRTYRSFYNTAYNTIIDKDYNSNRVILDGNEIRNSYIANGILDFQIEVNGYTTYSSTIELCHACVQPGAETYAYTDNDGNLYIENADINFVNTLFNKFYDKNGNEMNPYLYFINADKDYTGFDININQNAIRIDDTTFEIPAETLLDRGVVNGNYYIRINAYGYTETTTEDYVEITNACLPAPEVTFSFNNGNIYIKSNDKDYLKAIAKPYISKYETDEYGSWNCIESTRGGSISIWNNDNTSIYLENRKEYLNDKINYESTQYSFVDGSIKIPAEIVNTSCLPSGVYHISLYAYGYENKYNDNQYITTNVKQAPSIDDIKLYYDSTKGLTIKSSNNAWTSNIAKENDIWYGPGITFYRIGSKNDEYYRLSNNGYAKHINYNSTSHIASISQESLLSSGILEGYYTIQINSYGYTPVVIDFDTRIRGKKRIPVDVDVEVDENNNVIITSSDSDYLKALATGYEDSKTGFAYYSYMQFYSLDTNTDSRGATGNAVHTNSVNANGETRELESYNTARIVTGDAGRIVTGDAIKIVSGDGIKMVSGNAASIVSGNSTASGDADEKRWVSSVWIDKNDYDEENGLIFISSDRFSNNGIKSGKYLVKIDNLYYSTLNIGLCLATIDAPYQMYVGERAVADTHILNDVTWSSSDENVVKVDSNGLLTAVGEGYSIITAKYYIDDIEHSTTSYIWTYKIDTTVSAYANNTNGFVGETEQVYIKTDHADDDYIGYRSENDNLATVDENGLVTFVAPGKVKIYVSLYGKETYVQFTVYSVKKGLKVSGSIDDYQGYIEVADDATITMKDSEGTILNNSIFTFTSSNSSVATVDANGKITGKSAGTATIKAKVTNDPSSRYASISVKVVNRVAESLSLDITNTDDYIRRNEIIDGVRNVYVDYMGLGDNKIQLSSIALDKNGGEFNPSKITYTSTDSNVVSISSTGLVTIKKAGQVTITANVASNPKEKPVTCDIILRIIDYTPKIESKKVTINKYITAGETINVYPVYDSSISSISLSEESLFKAELIENDNKSYIKFTLKDRQTTKPKSYTDYLSLIVYGNEYTYKLSIVVSSTLPSVSIKTSGSYNTFTTENSLGFVPTSKNGIIDRYEFITKDSSGAKTGNWAYQDPVTGKITLERNKDTNKEILKGTVRFWFEGYNEGGYIDKTVSFKSTSTKPTVKLATTTISTFNPLKADSTIEHVLDGKTKTVKVQLIDKNKNPINTGKVEIVDGSIDSEITENVNANGYITLKINDIVSGKILLDYKGNDNWNGAIRLTITHKVTTAVPSAKLSATTLYLNTEYMANGSVDITTSSLDTVANVQIEELTEGLESVKFEYGKIKVSALNTGSYKVRLTPAIKIEGVQDPYWLKPVTLTVKVTNEDPSFSLAKTTIKLNAYKEYGNYVYHENVAVATKIKTNKFNAELIDVVASEILNYENESNVAKIDYNSETGTVSFTLNNKPDVGKYKFAINPKYKTVEGKTVTGKPYYVTISISNQIAKATMSISGSLNQLNLDTEATGTIKLSNIDTKVTGVEFVDYDTTDTNTDYKYIEAYMLDNGKAKIKLSSEAFNGDVGITDRKIVAGVVIHTEAGDIKISKVTISVARKTPTIKLVNSTINVYDTTGINAEVGRTKFTITGQGKIKDVVINESLAYIVNYDKTSEDIIVTLKDGAKLKSGSTSKFSLRVYWVGDYETGSPYLKSSTLTLSVKDTSGSVKAQ